MTGNVAMYVENLIAAGTISGPAHTGNMSIDRLYNEQPSEVYQVADTSIVITGDFADLVTPSILHLGNTNFTPDGTVTWELFSNTGQQGKVLEEEYEAVDTLLGWGEGTWDADNADGYVAPEFGHQNLTRPHTDVDAQSYRLTIDDPTNSDGFLQFGTFYAAVGFVPETNVAPDIEIGVEDPSEVGETDGNALRAEQRSPYRVARVRWARLFESEALQFRRLAHRVGRRGLALLTVFPDAGGQLEWETAMTGRISWNGPRRRPDLADNFYTLETQFREAL